MNKTILYIDGENIKHYIKTVLLSKRVKPAELNLENFRLDKLLSLSLRNIKISQKLYYSAKIRECSETIKKSKDLILKQRIQKNNLEKQGFKFIIAGNVRAQNIKIDGKQKIIFKEKGVDVRLAVDLTKNACDKLINTAILCSSDSDLQPAVREAVARGVKMIYLGFEISPNKGLSYTTQRTILIRNSEVLQIHKTFSEQ